MGVTGMSKVEQFMTRQTKLEQQLNGISKATMGLIDTMSFNMASDIGSRITDIMGSLFNDYNHISAAHAVAQASVKAFEPLFKYDNHISIAAAQASIKAFEPIFKNYGHISAAQSVNQASLKVFGSIFENNNYINAARTSVLGLSKAMEPLFANDSLLLAAQSSVKGMMDSLGPLLMSDGYMRIWNRDISKIITSLSTSIPYNDVEFDDDEGIESINNLSEDDISKLEEAFAKLADDQEELVSTYEEQSTILSEQNPMIAKVLGFIIVSVTLSLLLTVNDVDKLNEVANKTFAAIKDFTSICVEQIIALSKRNPTFAKVVQSIIDKAIVPFVIGYYTNCFFEARKDAKVKKLPDTKSETIYNITLNQQFKVVDSVPYYYAIELLNPETNETIRGYVLKSATKPIELPSNESECAKEITNE